MGARKFTLKEQKTVTSPVASRLNSLYSSGTMIVGMQGGQGTGKSTLVKYIVKSLQKKGHTVVSFSIDDFYKSLKEREKLSKKYPSNPFYQIPRGMPGTHDLKDLELVFKKAKAGKDFSIPHFDKSLHQGRGDRTKKLTKVSKRVDFVIIEGWCVGLPSVSSEKFVGLCDSHKIDPLATHHKIVLKYLKDYQPLWKYLDFMIQLKPTSMSVHKKWRQLQEKRNKQGMSAAKVSHFIEPYLPFTCLGYKKIEPDLTISIDLNHNYSLWTTKRKTL